MSKRLQLKDALSLLKARAKRSGPVALETFVALDEYYALEAKSLEGLRAAAGVSQRELARRAGIDQADVSKILSGKVDPRWSTVRRLLLGLRKLAPAGATSPTRPKKRSHAKGSRQSPAPRVLAYRKRSR